MDVLPITPQKPLPKEAGGKAHGLRLIMTAGLPIPAAWVVMPGVSDSSLAVLEEHIRQQGIRLLAVRSSAVEEDGEQYSFAGIHESRLAVKVEQLSEAVKQVSRSACTERADAYRKGMGLPPASGPCAVIVQEMIASERSGIAFGEGMGGERISIEAVEGLGETAVDGRAVPETLSLRLADDRWRIEQRTRRIQPVALRIQEGRLSTLETNEKKRSEYILDESRAMSIAEGVARLETVAERSLDVEWAFTGNRLWYLQARPQSRPLHDEIPAGEYWTRINAREVLPEIPSAFSRSLLVKPFNEAERASLESYGIYTDRSIPFLTFVYGRAVFNERIYTVADLLGVSRDFLQAEFGGSDEAKSEVKPLDFRKVMRHPLVMLRAVAVSLRAERQANRFIKQLHEYGNKLESMDTDAMGHEALFEIMEQAPDLIMQPFVLNSIRVAATAGNSQYYLLRQLQGLKVPGKEPWSLLAQLVSGGEASVSTQQIDDLVALAKTFNSWSGSGEFAGHIVADHARPHYWQERLPSHIWRRVEGWLDKYGHRGPYESDLSHPRYRDDLRLLARALFPLMSEDALTRASSRQQLRREGAIRTWDLVNSHCSLPGRYIIKARVRQLKRLLSLRERQRSVAMKAIAPFRNILINLGRRLEKDHRLHSHSEIWHLSLDEIKRAFRNPMLDIQIAVNRERSRLAAWRRISVPNRFVSDDIASFASPGASTGNNQSAFHGNGISPGAITGKVAVMRSPLEGSLFPSGAILVAPATDPSWTPIFARALGIVVELGGALSHAGIVAREYGIPCVANIPDAIHLLQDGDWIRLDGSAGTVTLLDGDQEQYGPVDSID